MLRSPKRSQFARERQPRSAANLSIPRPLAFATSSSRFLAGAFISNRTADPEFFDDDEAAEDETFRFLPNNK